MTSRHHYLSACHTSGHKEAASSPDPLTSNAPTDWLKSSLSKPLTASQKHDHPVHDANATIHTNTHHDYTREGCISDVTSRLLKQAAAGSDWLTLGAFTGGRRPPFSTLLSGDKPPTMCEGRSPVTNLYSIIFWAPTQSSRLSSRSSV